MKLRPLTETERMYSYTQSSQISAQTGLIGYLRADMGSDGIGFFSTWNDYRQDLKTEEFKAEFDDVINSLRFDDNFGGLLKSRGALAKKCYSTPESSFGNDREYGFRAETEKYAYIMRLNPNKGEYNLYCFCYRKDWLDQHLHNAEKGIRFITPTYNEIFKLKDGGSVVLNRSDGSSKTVICRYIDEYHLEFGNNVYHICELAEMFAHNNVNLIPDERALPDGKIAIRADYQC